MRKVIEKALEKAKVTSLAMIGIKMKTTLEERREIVRRGFNLSTPRVALGGLVIVTWPQEKRAEELRKKVNERKEKG